MAEQSHSQPASEDGFIPGLRLSPRHADIARGLAPLFAQIAAGAARRDRLRILPYEEIELLKQAGLTRLRLPVSHGGGGMDITDFNRVLIALARADSNIAQALRSHFAFVEELLLEPEQSEFRLRWLDRLAGGAVLGGALTETGPGAKLGRLQTEILREGETIRLNGRKFYATGAIFADWLNVAARDGERPLVWATLPRHTPGVQLLDDWDGIGQRLTGSGTAIFTEVAIQPQEIYETSERFIAKSVVYQLVHLATLAGIAQGLEEELALQLRQRNRTFSNASAATAAADPLLLQVVGKVAGAAYATRAIVLQLAQSLQQLHNLIAADGVTPAAEAATTELLLDVARAQGVVIGLVLKAASEGYDALAASALRETSGLDRFWRNARTISSHNPHVYKQRIAGDHAVNGTVPPRQWAVGIPD